jgi:hypothetical protein
VAEVCLALGDLAAKTDPGQALDWYRKGAAIYAEIESKGKLNAVSSGLRDRLLKSMAALGRR